MISAERADPGMNPDCYHPAPSAKRCPKVRLDPRTSRSMAVLKVAGVPAGRSCRVKVGGRGRVQHFLLVVFAVLVLNFLAAVVTVLRRAQRGSWLLVLLLSSTTGAGLAVVIGLLLADLDARSVDVALVFTALASISALAAVAVFSRRSGRGRDVG